MKYYRLSILLGLFIVMMIAKGCDNSICRQPEQIFERGQKVTEHFTGDTWVQMLTTDGANFDAMSYNVTFAAGSRTDWHSHPGGQILYCISGEGRCQEKGKAVQHLNVGDVVEIKPDVVHWHGAAPGSDFVHLGISTQLSKGPVSWLGAVTDKEYNNQ